MLLPCEIAIKYFIPALRASIAKILFEKYNLTQMEIALKLGVTQAAISKYLSGKYSKEIKTIERKKTIKSLSKEFALALVKKRKAKIDFSKNFCTHCKILGKRIICEVVK
jgi:hypothetical protein